MRQTAGKVSMARRLRVQRWRDAIGSLATIAAIAVLFPMPAASQGQARTPDPVDLPRGPAKPGFDITRFANVANGMFVTFYVTRTEALRDALKTGRVAEDTRVLVTDTASGRLALLMDQMAFHHSAQGRAGNKDWMATF
jgi:hypothetical protein